MDNNLKKNSNDNYFSNFLKNKNTLASFYYDLTGKQINPEDIVFDTVNLELKKEIEHVAFHVKTKYVILFKVQNTLTQKDIVLISAYMFTIFVNFYDEYYGEGYPSNKKVLAPAIEAYVIYTGTQELPDMESLFSDKQDSGINARMEIVTLKNSKGLVHQFIEHLKSEEE